MALCSESWIFFKNVSRKEKFSDDPLHNYLEVLVHVPFTTNKTEFDYIWVAEQLKELAPRK